MRPWIAAMVFLSCVQLTGCAAGMASQLAPTDAPRPISVAETETHPIAFARLVVRVLAGTTVGHHYDGLAKVRQFPHRWQAGISVAGDEFAIVAAEILRDYGYQVLGSESVVFRRDDAARARFQFGGTVTELFYDTYAPLAGNYEEAVLGVEWELLDTYLDSVVYKVRTRGHARLQVGSGSVVHPAFSDALTRVLSDRKFVEHLESDTREPSVADSGTPILVATCGLSAERRLPEMVEEAFRSVVIVRPGVTLGSGVIIGPDGHLITAAHVVSGLQNVPVRLRSGITIDAAVVGVDRRQDVALLKLPGSNHDCLPITSARVGLGTDLFAIGSPRMEELSYSVSRGVVSGYRDLDGREYIQTDASLNPGNSGGPLLTAEGRIVAIVSWKIVSPGTEGLAFGVPIDVALRTLGITFR